MTTGAVSGDRDDPAAGDLGSAEQGSRDATLHPRPTSRRGRADARRRTPPPSPAYNTSAVDDVRPAPPAQATGSRSAPPSLAADYVGSPRPPSGTVRAEGRGDRVTSPPDGRAPTGPSSGARSRPRHRARGNVRRRRALLLAGIGALTVAGTGLAVVGLSEVRTSTAGRYEETLGPTDPGYQAYVVPTPTMGVLHQAADGGLAGAALLALESGDEGGSVIVVPPATTSGPDSTTTVADVFRDEGAEAAAEALGVAVTVGVADHVLVDDAQWAQLVGPVGGVEVTLDTPVGDWPAGPVTLDPAEVGPFLAARDEGETDLERVARQELFWNAWLASVGEEGESALPGEVGSGLGRFVLGVARDGSAAELPVRRDESGDAVLFRPDVGRIGEFVSLTVPYPLAATPGGRVRVRLLNGTGDPGVSVTAARALVASGAQISIVGNATSFDVAETSLVYFGEDRETLAGWLRVNLGGGRVEEVPNGQDGQVSSDDEIDVTVILGQDAGELIGEVEDP